MERKRVERIISAKVGEDLDAALEKYIALDTHTTKSEYIREALRERLERDAEKLGLTLVELARLPLEELQRRIEYKIFGVGNASSDNQNKDSRV
jgi:Arc/MetJ-type ribon-helix-helix transcriptional regulator